MKTYKWAQAGRDIKALEAAGNTSLGDHAAQKWALYHFMAEWARLGLPRVAERNRKISVSDGHPDQEQAKQNYERSSQELVDLRVALPAAPLSKYANIGAWFESVEWE